MSAALFVDLIVLLALPLTRRLAILDGWKGLPRLAAALVIAQLIATWLGFSGYLLFGMGPAALWSAIAVLSWAVVRAWRGVSLPLPVWRWREQAPPLLFATLFTLPFLLAWTVFPNGTVEFGYNFFDAPFHLSVAQAFLSDPRFPPLDLNVAGYPLKYHFMTDFLLALLSVGHWDLLRTFHALTCVQAFLTALVIWGAVERFLVHPKPLAIGAACVLFSFCIPVLSNGLHWLLYRPPYFLPNSLYGHLYYFYFHFENPNFGLFQPQRAMVFGWPAALIVLSGIGTLWRQPSREVYLQALWLLALLPFAHSTSFLFVSVYLAVFVLFRWRWALSHVKAAFLPGAVALAQVGYISLFGPSAPAGYSGWDAARHIPTAEFANVPAFLRRGLFWCFTYSEFILLAGLSGLSAWLQRRRADVALFFDVPMRAFLGTALAFFLFINVYRYTANWGDSNKWVVFLSLTIAMMVGQMLSVSFDKNRRAGAWASGLLIALCLIPWSAHIVIYGRTRVKAFDEAEVLASQWIRQNTGPQDRFVTTADDWIHFLEPLAGRAALQGIYANVALYGNRDVQAGVRALYETADFRILDRVPARYIVVSRWERMRYRLHPLFNAPAGLLFSTRSQDGVEVRLYGVPELRASTGIAPSPSAPTP